MIHWQGGLAEVVEVKGSLITVLCPHCGEKHTHGRQMLGSRNAVAGCHTGFSRLREYRIPESTRSANRPARTKPQVSNRQRATETTEPANAVAS